MGRSNLFTVNIFIFQINVDSNALAWIWVQQNNDLYIETWSSTCIWQSRLCEVKVARTHSQKGSDEFFKLMTVE